jgi:hypothetical protein
MTAIDIPPQTSPLTDVTHQLQTAGYAILSAASVCAWTQCSLDELNAIAQSWHGMPADPYLKDGGRYRTRRHASFTFDQGVVSPVAHRAHWQPLTYNALHGGMTRWFEPMPAEVVASAAWLRLLRAFGQTAVDLRAKDTAASKPPVQCIEAHQFRIDTTDGIGRPTPEGAHRDGVDLVGVFMLHRQDIKGGETRVFDARGTSGERFTLQEPWSLLLLDDARVIHETTPIQPTQAGGYRDTLVLTAKQGTFLQEI